MNPRPVDYVCTEDGFKPVDRMRWLHRRQYAIGKVYKLAPFEERTHAAHGSFFKAINLSWKNLPEAEAKRFPSAEHLRKYATIRCGYSDEHIFPFDTPESAEALLPVLRDLYGEFAIIKISENVINVFTAKSLKMTGDGALNEQEFKKARRDILDYCAGLIGVTAKTLEQQVSNSSRSDNTETDKSAAPGVAPKGAADNQSPPPWVTTYIAELENTRTADPRALKRRHDEAVVKIGGKPTERDLELMRKVYGQCQRMLTGAITRDQYFAELEKIGIVHPDKQGAAA
jgi:hypothetical protein